MRFLIGLVCASALLGAVSAQNGCEACKGLVDALREIRGEVSEQSCDEYDGDERSMCRNIVKSAGDIEENLLSSQRICENSDFCNPPRSTSLDPQTRPSFDPEAVRDVVLIGVTAVGVLALATFMSPALVPVLLPAAVGRRKRDLTSTEEEMAGIYGEDEFDPFESMDPTINPSLDLPEELDSYMMKAASTLKCALCKLGISKESPTLNAILEQFGQDGAAMRMLLCRSLPEKGDQRKCMTVLRQASETLLQIKGSLIGSQDSCQGLTSCQTG